MGPYKVRSKKKIRLEISCNLKNADGKRNMNTHNSASPLL